MKQMLNLLHVNTSKCIGCTRCMRICPTEAIRIIDKKATLATDKCIYCGRCFQTCQVNAIQVNANQRSDLEEGKYHIAILPIAIYGMIKSKEDLNVIYHALYDQGFNEVFELSPVYKVLSEKIEAYVQQHHDYPYILTQCPTILKLTQLNHTSLVSKFLPFNFPYEIVAQYIKLKHIKQLNLDVSQVRVSYITECLANLHAISDAVGKHNSEIDHVFLLSTLFKDILKHLEATHQQSISTQRDGILWAKVGALRRTTDIHEYLSVDGISYVGTILEKVELNQLDHIKLLECYSCVSGCVGGTFTLENPFVAKTKINGLYEQLTESDDEFTKTLRQLEDISWEFEKPLEQFARRALDEDFMTSLMKLQAINQLYEQLPQIDCCACGSPSCRALAEDVVSGKKQFEDCVVRNKREEKN